MNWEEKMEREVQNDTVIDDVISLMLHNASCENVLMTTGVVREYRNRIYSIQEQSPDLEKLYGAINIPVLSRERGHGGYYIGCTPDGEEMHNIGMYYFTQKEERGSYEIIYHQAGLENAVYRYYEELLGKYRRALLKQKAKPREIVSTGEFELA